MTAPAAAPSAEEPAADPGADPATPTTPRTEQPGASKPAPLPTTPTRVTPDSSTPTSTPPASSAGTASSAPAKTSPTATTPASPTKPGAAESTTGSAKPDATKADTAKTDTKADPGITDTKSDDVKPDTPTAAPPVDAAALNSLAGPLLNTAVGIPAAALQGAGALVPGIAGAVMPTLAALLGQLGTGATPAAPVSRISGYPSALTSGPLSSLPGSGPAADQARNKSATMAGQVAALKQIEQQLGDVLGVSSAKTDAARATLNGIIYDVETAIVSASVQGNTPEAQAAVLKAMQQALDNAGSVVSTAARDKMTDAAFVRQLIKEYLSGGSPADRPASGVDHLMSGAASGRGATAVLAARRYLGTPYVWGGGGALGPSNGGFDCSGLTQYAIAQATGGRMILPRTTYDQIHCGRPVSLSALRPGDLVFSNFSSPGVPEHVQLYIGGGQVIEAPQRGVPVQISSLPSNAQARRVL